MVNQHAIKSCTVPILDGVIMLTYYQDIYMWKVFFPVRQESAVFLANLWTMALCSIYM